MDLTASKENLPAAVPQKTVLRVCLVMVFGYGCKIRELHTELSSVCLICSRCRAAYSVRCFRYDSHITSV